MQTTHSIATTLFTCLAISLCQVGALHAQTPCPNEPGEDGSLPECIDEDATDLAPIAPPRPDAKMLAEQADLAGRYTEALDLFKQAYEDEADPYYLYRIALLHEKLADPVKALEVLRADERAILASERVRELPLLIARLERQVQPVAAPARQLTRTSPPVLDTPARTRSDRAPWIVMGGGFTMIVAGGALVAGSLGDDGRLDELEDECASPTGCEFTEQQLEDARRRARNSRVAGFTVGALGVGALAGGIIWQVIKKRREEEGSKPAALLDTVELEPALAPGSSGLLMTVRF